MTLRRLAVSLALLLALAVGATLWRMQARAAQSLALYPPSGQFVMVDGLRVHYTVAGTGPDVVLIHGASGSLRDFSFALLPSLAKTYRVIAFDRPGLGYSDPLPAGEISLAAQARHLRAAALQLGAADPVVVGQSYGGAVALAWALQAPPAALVLIGAPSLPWPGTLDPWYSVNEHALARAVLMPLAAAWVPDAYVRRAIAGVFAPASAPEGYADHLGPGLTIRRTALDINVRQVNALRAQLVQMEPLYPSLTLPVELIHGDADTIVPLHIHSGPLAPRLANATLTVIPGAGHMPHHTHPQTVLDAVSRATLQ